MPMHCAACRTSFPVADQKSAAPVHCPHCGQAATLLPSPLAGEEAIPDVLPAADASPQPEPSFLDRWGQKQSGKLIVKLIFLVLLMPCGGIGLLIEKWGDVALARAAQQPQVISCRQLSNLGPGSNPHVVLTDYRLVTERLAAGRALALPAELEGDQQSMRLLIEVEGSDQTARLAALERAERLQGMVVPAKEVMGLGDRVRVGRDYPKLDLNRCWVLQVDKQPPRLWQAYAWVGLGGAMIVLGLCIWLGLGHLWFTTTPEKVQ